MPDSLAASDTRCQIEIKQAAIGVREDDAALRLISAAMQEIETVTHMYVPMGQKHKHGHCWRERLYKSNEQVTGRTTSRIRDTGG
jgi:hypothetical protein